MRHVHDLLKTIPGSRPPALSADELMLQAAEISRQAAGQLALEREQARQRRMGDFLARSAIPLRYREAELKPACRQQDAAYAAGAEFMRGFDGRLKTGGGMVLYGPVGTGKTHLACAMANALIAQLRPVMYCTALEAVALVKASWRRGVEVESEFDVYARFAEPQLLIIDEIGVQLGSEFERIVLTSIADLRSRGCLPTVAISNLEPVRMLDLLGERLFDRLVGFGADVVAVPGVSLRSVGRG